MRKTSEEFNCAVIIKNIGCLCGETELNELPYWETINDFLKDLATEDLQEIVSQLTRRLLRSRAFERARIRERYWQINLDGTQIYSGRKPLHEMSMFRVHNRDTEEEYTEYYVYLLEAKVVLHEKIHVSIMTEFVENEEREQEKQDCERKACRHLMEQLKKAFAHLPVCICADSLYAREGFFERCRQNRWKYIIRYKEGSIPTVYQEYEMLKGREKNRKEIKHAGDIVWHDYITGIDYNGYEQNVLEYGEKTTKGRREFRFITNLPINEKNVAKTAEAGRRRWKIENEGFNRQKRHGYHLEHLFSHNYQAIKNHYYLIQIGHMIAQIMENWESLWKKVRQSIEQRHRRVMESLKQLCIENYEEELEATIQIRLS